jgi:hypothetical protein
MAKDAVATMGTILPGDAGGRDAVHVAVFSARAKEPVFPGQDVAIVEHKDVDVLVAAQEKDTVGIVDPFLKELVVHPGARFWVYLYPRTITGLSHRWTHPDFDGVEVPEAYATPARRLESERWLREFCDQADCPQYEKLIALVDEAIEHDGVVNYGEDYSVRLGSESLHFNGTDAHGGIPAEFWDHMANVLGKPMPYRPQYFSCSC